MNKLILFLLPLTLLGLSACAATPIPVAVTTTAVPRISLDLPEPKPVQLDKVQWKVVQVGNQELFTLDNKDFTNLIINMTKTKELLIEEKSLVNTYKGYYENPKGVTPIIKK